MHFNSFQIKGKKIITKRCSVQTAWIYSIDCAEWRVFCPTPHWKTTLIKPACDFIRVHKNSKDRNKANLLHSCKKLPTLRAVVPWAAHSSRATGSSNTKPARRAWKAFLFRGQACPVAPGARGTLVLHRVLCAWWAVVTNWAWSGRLLLPPSSCKKQRQI